MTWTKEKLAAMSPQGRSQLFANARKLGTPEAAAVIKLLEESGLPYSEPGWLKADDPLTLAIERIVRSAAGREAMLKAARAGLPAIVGVDPMLNDALGVDYGGHNHATLEAGFRVGAVMQELGWRHSGKVKLPPGCVAKTAELWVK